VFRQVRQILDEDGSHSVAWGFGFGERIGDLQAGVSETVFVTADHPEKVNECRRPQEGIKGWHRLSQAEATPLVSHTFVHQKEAISELSREPLGPLFQGACLGLVVHHCGQIVRGFRRNLAEGRSRELKKRGQVESSVCFASPSKPGGALG